MQGTIKDFFISYSNNDTAWAEWITWQLENAGYSGIYQKRDFLPGGEFTFDIHNALQNCRNVIALFSPSYLQSTWCLKEALTALAYDVAGEDHKLIPVRILPCKPTGVLKTRIYIDLVGLELEEAAAVLIKALQNLGSNELKPGQESTAATGQYSGALPAVAVLSSWPRVRKYLFRGSVVLFLLLLLGLICYFILIKDKTAPHESTGNVRTAAPPSPSAAPVDSRPVTHIEQQSQGDKSPNIISGGGCEYRFS